MSRSDWHNHLLLLSQGLVLQAFEANQQRCSSAWLTTQQPVPQPDQKAVINALMACAANTNDGWERLAGPLVLLGMGLIEHSGCKVPALAERLHAGKPSAVACI